MIPRMLRWFALSVAFTFMQHAVALMAGLEAPPLVPRKSPHREFLSKHLANTRNGSYDAGFCFISFGCWGGRNQRTQRLVADQIARTAHQRQIDFVIGAGDNFYSWGVTDETDPQFSTKFESVYNGSQKLREVPFFMALGNHDYKGNILGQMDYTTKHLRSPTSRTEVPAATTTTTSDKNGSTSPLSPPSGRWYLPYAYYAQLLGDSLLLLVLDCPLLEECYVSTIPGTPKCALLGPTLSNDMGS